MSKKMVGKYRQSTNIEDARSQPEPDANIQDFPVMPTAKSVKKAMDKSDINSNLVEKTPVKDWKRSDPIEGVIDTNNMFSSTSNRTRIESNLQHLTGPASQTPKFKKIKSKIK